MTDDRTLLAHVDKLETLLGEKFGLTRGPLARRLARLGRRVPGSVRRDLQQVEQARFLSGHPKLRHVTDPRLVDQAYGRAVEHLTAIDVADRRKGRAINLLATILFNLLAVAALMIVLMVWRGLV